MGLRRRARREAVLCFKCENYHDGTFGSGKFCSRGCANSRAKGEASKIKVSNTLKSKRKDVFIVKSCPGCGVDFSSRRKLKQKFCSMDCCNKHKMFSPERNKNIENLWEISSRTRSKLIKRMGKGCCICGWEEGTCDLHHINGRKVENPNRAENLTLLCPNCHRLVHENKIDKQKLISVDLYLKDWKKYYYG